MSDATLYIEAFVENAGHQYRWRIFESDPGLLHIEYQEWNDTDKKYETREGDPTVSFSSEYAELICDAIKRVAATAC